MKRWKVNVFQGNVYTLIVDKYLRLWALTWIACSRERDILKWFFPRIIVLTIYMSKNNIKNNICIILYTYWCYDCYLIPLSSCYLFTLKKLFTFLFLAIRLFRYKMHHEHGHRLPFIPSLLTMFALAKNYSQVKHLF